MSREIGAYAGCVDRVGETDFDRRALGKQFEDLNETDVNAVGRVRKSCLSVARWSHRNSARDKEAARLTADLEFDAVAIEKCEQCFPRRADTRDRNVAVIDAPRIADLTGTVTTAGDDEDGRWIFSIRHRRVREPHGNPVVRVGPGASKVVHEARPAKYAFDVVARDVTRPHFVVERAVELGSKWSGQRHEHTTFAQGARLGRFGSEQRESFTSGPFLRRSKRAPLSAVPPSTRAHSLFSADVPQTFVSGSPQARKQILGQLDDR